MPSFFQILIFIYCIYNINTRNNIRDSCLSLENTVCIDNVAIGPRYLGDGILGYWTFDDELNQDYSIFSNDLRIVDENLLKIESNKDENGNLININNNVNDDDDNDIFNRNHKDSIEYGPSGHNSIGSSLYYSNNFTGYSLIPHIVEYETTTFSVSLWIYLYDYIAPNDKSVDKNYVNKDGEHGCKSIFTKGNKGNRNPSVEICYPSRHLYLSIADDEHRFMNSIIKMKSIAQIPIGTWSNIVVNMEKNYIQLYINGVLDSQRILVSPNIVNKGDIYIGKHPEQGDFNAEFLLDELMISNSPLSKNAIQQITSFLYGYTGYPTYGCRQCSLEQAEKSCDVGYHICTKMEYNSGALFFARLHGWINAYDTASLWFLSDNHFKKEGNSLCCRNFI